MSAGGKNYNKDYYGGALMILLGGSAAYAAQSYNIGSLAHMGPGYFPFAVGILLALTGVLIALNAKKTGPGDEAVLVGHKHEIPDFRGAACIILGTIAFYFCGEYLGLLPATFAIVFICALGDRSNSVMACFVLAMSMMIVAVVIFWWALQVQMPLVRWGM
ncbi:tripartite tricarboxylate transporter TctB family protein [Comamonas sp.]|uniref:tripartite tricarboxylate transporter TctB family protein n=1 Tax=Comamonas sp. TaxID=34028 RepID=UPI003D0F3779